MLMTSAAVFALLAAQPVPVPPVEELEARILNARKRVIRGELVIDARDVGGRAKPTPKEFHVWFDGDKFRHDCRLQSQEGGPLRRIRCRNCPTAGQHIRYNDEPAKTGGVNAVQVTRMKDPNHAWFEVLDPRGLGLVPSYVDALAGRRMDYLLGRPDRKNLSVSLQTWKGQDCYRIDFELRPKVMAQVWMVPAWGDNVVRVQLSGVTKAGTSLVDTVDTEVARAGVDGVWFPKVCTYTRMMGGELEARQVAKIEAISLNRPIDPRVFTLSGMDLPAPIPVLSDNPDPRKPVVAWDGKRLVDASRYISAGRSHPSVIVRPDPAGPYRVWLWVASGVAAAVAVLAVWRLRRQPA